ncbi:MAG: lipid-binding SYLF domain-containing protein [Myxococcaceae bacterium]
MQRQGAIQKFRKLVSLAKMERKVSRELHGDVQAKVRRLEREDPGLRQLLEGARGYAVFPWVGKASAVLGGTFGKGEVFEKGWLVGYAGIVQLTLGVQLGGQTFSEILIFHDEQALERFKQGKINFAANASAVAVKAGVAESNDKQGTEVRLYSDGGFHLEAALGGQKFIFKHAALTMGKRLEHAEEHAAH